MAFEMSRGKVPHFSMRPHPLVTGAMIMILVIGLLVSLSFFAKDAGTGIYRQHGILTLVITAILCIFLLIVGTAKVWYSHLWKRNSSHSRHKEHSRHHPAFQKKESPHKSSRDRNNTRNRRR